MTTLGLMLQLSKLHPSHTCANSGRDDLDSLYSLIDPNDRSSDHSLELQLFQLLQPYDQVFYKNQ